MILILDRITLRQRIMTWTLILARITLIPSGLTMTLILGRTISNLRILSKILTLAPTISNLQILMQILTLAPTISTPNKTLIPIQILMQNLISRAVTLTTIEYMAKTSSIISQMIHLIDSSPSNPISSLTSSHLSNPRMLTFKTARET